MRSEVSDLLTSKEALLGAFLNVREITEDIVKSLGPEDMVLSTTADTSPPKWHLGHTSWFFDKFLLRKEGESAEYDYLFNSYYKTLGAHIPKSKRSYISRPDVGEVMKYRSQVTTRISEIIANLDVDSYAEIAKLVELGIHHEQQHQELLFMDIKRNFAENPMKPRFEAHELNWIATIPRPSWQNIPSELVKIGHPRNSAEFAYDNEGDSHYHWVDSFMLSTHLVTNGEYLSFMEEGGYDDPSLWLSDGWDMKEKEGWSHPLYWEKKDNQWWVMTLSGLVPLDLSAPASHVSYYEAKAYAEWKGCRLPTEFEWEAAAQREPIKGQFMENGHHEPRVPQEEHTLFSQIHGTLWQWTQSAYLSYPRYEPLPGAISEYNGKFMCNQMVLRGGSCITPRSHYRTTYRNFYYPHNRWQYSGIRLAKDLL